MKKVLFAAAFLTLTSAIFAQKKASDVAKFNTETIQLGKVQQGHPVTATFIVTNISTSPLIIEQANPTCGCTISNYTKEPIAPGKTGTINATYNAASMGHFEKHLTVKFAGIDEMKSITLTGEVMAPADYQKWKTDDSVATAVREKAVADSLAALKPVKKHKKSKPASTATVTP